MVHFFVLHQNAHQFILKTSRKKSDLSLDWVNKLSNLEIGFPGENGPGWRGRRVEKAVSVPSPSLWWGRRKSPPVSLLAKYLGWGSFFPSDQTGGEAAQPPPTWWWAVTLCFAFVHSQS